MEWPIVKLGDICDFQNGFAFKSKLFTDIGVPILRISNIQSGSIDLKRVAYTDPNSYKENLDRYRVVDGDLLIAMSGATTGKIGINNTGIDFLLNQRVGKFVPSNKLDKQYLYYYLSTQVEKHLEISAGAAQPNLSTEQIKGMKIPFPPIPEQKFIVATLDQAFADIEQARAKTEKNLKNARELFESYLQQVFSQRGECWTETNLGAVAGFKNGLNFSQSSKGEKLKVVGVKDFKSNFMVPFEQLETIQIDGDLSEAYELKENDIITVRSNGNKRLIGRCLLMGKVDDNTSYSGFTIRIRLEDKSISPRFLAYYLKSSSTHELLINSGEGANISNLNQKILTSLPVAFPHLDKQMKLVEGIEKVESETKKLENIYANKLNTIDKLKKSILQKAFSGELTKEKEGAVA